MSESRTRTEVRERAAPPSRVSRRTLGVVLATAAAAILLRSFVYLLQEQLAFDSDQAITGLMAKHLAEGRAFPLFFYGQTYLLAVEAWAAAPIFAVAGPTVAALRVSLVLWNVAFAWLLITTLNRGNGLDPWLALASAVFFVLAPVSVAAQLMNAQGAIVEPYVYVAALWLLRGRPLWFGAVLAIGFRNREFVAYAVPAMLVVEALAQRLDRARGREWLAAGVAFAAVWQGIEALKPFADLLGPGTRGVSVGGASVSQIANLRDRFEFALPAMPHRLTTLGPQILGWLSGAHQMNSSFPVADRPWIAAAAAIFLALAAGRIAVLVLQPSRTRRRSWRAGVADRIARADFALYLAAVGATAIVAFIAGRPVLAGYGRYVLLGLLFPTGLVAGLFLLESNPAVTRTAAAFVAVFALIAARDHVVVALSYIRHPELNASRIVADALVSDGIPAAKAGYWRAYVITFLARERVRVASSDFVRITTYQDEFADHLAHAVVISDRPCDGGRLVGTLYICRP